jgi:hypothetical protein
MTCIYKDLFGLPNTGIHSYRLLNFAIVDVSLTVMAGVILSYIYKIHLMNGIIIFFILGIILHRLFCVNTKLNVILFGELNNT